MGQFDGVLRVRAAALARHVADETKRLLAPSRRPKVIVSCSTCDLAALWRPAKGRKLSARPRKIAAETVSMRRIPLGGTGLWPATGAATLSGSAWPVTRTANPDANATMPAATLIRRVEARDLNTHGLSPDRPLASTDNAATTSRLSSTLRHHQWLAVPLAIAVLGPGTSEYGNTDLEGNGDGHDHRRCGRAQRDPAVLDE